MLSQSPQDLPVAAHLRQIVAASRSSPLVVTAPPGSGKTTLIPAALLDDLNSRDRNSQQRVLLLQPRRLAARSVARHIAHLRGTPLRTEVGYQVRFDNATSPDTRLIAMTTGVLLRRLIDDLALDDVDAVVLDEFHERTVEMDLVLGMLWRIRSTIRPDLRLVVMSATIDATPISRLLNNCPTIHAEGTMHPVVIRYLRRPDRRTLSEQVASVLNQAITDTDGDTLVFLPGVGEIHRCQEALAPFCDRQGFELMLLYGDLPPEQQDRVLAPSERRKIILSTNVAETSLTIDGVTAVIDSGLARQLQVHPGTGLPRLELLPISRASADQRAGRAGRTAPGVCFRLWDQASHRGRPAAETPEIRRSELSSTLLQLAACGERDPLDFPWLDPPTTDALTSAIRVLQCVGAFEHSSSPLQLGTLSDMGKKLANLPTHPRLARLVIAGAEYGVLRETTLVSALLSERDPFRAGQQTSRGPRDQRGLRSRSDVVDRVALLQMFHAQGTTNDADLVVHPGAARNVLRVAEQLFQQSDFPRRPRADDVSSALMRALLDAFPDRVTKLRSNTQDRGLMVGGRGVRLERGSRVQGEPLFLSIDLQDAAGDARVSLASAVDRDWLPSQFLQTVDELFFNPTRKQVEARRCTYWMDLPLEETPIAILDLQQAANILAVHARQSLDRILPNDDSAASRFRSRTRWLAEALPELELPALGDEAITQNLPLICQELRSLDELKRADWLTYFQQLIGFDRLAEIERLAPEAIQLPNGKRTKLQYVLGKPPILSIRIQELFGVPATPCVAGGRIPVLLELLGPNFRPQQVTNDLASFWKNTYPVVRKELRRRYPKHAWPEDPFAGK
ncbi:MAG: ATP-dependent helicase HrpB [Pirellulaceae bacterium]|nr:ATP-dependent helicase HrpB [Planctomycetales bacterium]